MKFKRGITTPLHGWQGAKPKSVGFVQTILEKEDMIVAFCSGEARVLASEVVKLIPLDRGQHVRLRNDVKEPRFVSAIHSEFFSEDATKAVNFFCCNSVTEVIILYGVD